MIRQKKNQAQPWSPCPGDLALYESASSTLSRGCLVRVAAEACGDRWRVEIIGRNGLPVMVTVKRKNLSQMPPSLF